MITYGKALEQVLSAVARLPSFRVSLADALGLAAAADVLADEPVPPFTNSAMDGFAVRSADCAGASSERPAHLRVLAEVWAGRVAAYRVDRGTAVRIMTGAPVPEGADAIVPIESASVTGEWIDVPRPVRPGANIRLAGEDIEVGARVVEAGSTLRPAEIGVLAATGRVEVLAVPRARIAVLTTGDELVDASDVPGPGQIRDANVHSVCAQTAAFGAVAIPFPRVPDRRDAVEGALREAAAAADVIVTNGGISMGDSDFVKMVLDDLGAQRSFWRVAQKPGGPLGFWILDGKPVFGIPGNPVAAMVMMEEYVRPALRKMMGYSKLYRPEHEGVLDRAWSKTMPDGRLQFLRVLAREHEGTLHAALTGPQGSGILSSMTRANALALVPEDVTALPQGSRVPLHMTEQPEDH